MKVPDFIRSISIRILPGFKQKAHINRFDFFTSGNHSIYCCVCFVIPLSGSIRTALANSVESDLGCTSRIYFDNLMLMLHNMRLTSNHANTISSVIAANKQL